MPDFASHGHASLNAAGLGRGGARVCLDGGKLTLLSHRGQLAIAIESVERLRFGYSAHMLTGGIYQVIVWSSATSRPLVIRAARDQDEVFRSFARMFSSEVAERRGIASVERGLGRMDSIVEPLLFLPALAVGAGGTFIAARQGESALIPLLALGVVLMIAAMFGYYYLRKDRPRALGTLDELEIVLPQRQ